MSLIDILLLAALALVIVLLLVLVLRPRSIELGPVVEQSSERLERSLRDEITRNSGGMRQELLATLAQFQQTLLAQSGDVARTQNEQIDSFRVQLAGLQQSLAAQALAAREAQDQAMHRLTDAMRERLNAMQQDNEKKLEQMRATVDEKLHATLEQRLGESFKQVAERLEQVHKGLGEMQGLARDVGSLNRVLTNVKTRGIFGEVQLAGLLEQVFTPEQYASNVSTVPNSAERVEFAIRLPGQRSDGAPLWLPIDAKFPRDDYERLLDAQERADAVGVETSGKAIESRLRLEARTIREKYVAPPHTTDFGILFVPTEGLYAEALRRPGLVESLQREHKVMLCGPTTLLATLNSLQMGFRTLALEKRSAEVWEVLGAVKTEFGKFGEILAKTKKKLEEASNTIDAAEVRTRAMTRRLKSVESLPEGEALLKLGVSAVSEPEDDEA
ncbi:MAG TPA: DNA recombination protein RmuC [Burkholderiaceae bacterium]|jgi:DNA recombination protein RmuC